MTQSLRATVEVVLHFPPHPPAGGAGVLGDDRQHRPQVGAHLGSVVAPGTCSILGNKVKYGT